MLRRTQGSCEQCTSAIWGTVANKIQHQLRGSRTHTVHDDCAGDIILVLYIRYSLYLNSRIFSRRIGITALVVVLSGVWGNLSDF